MTRDLANAGVQNWRINLKKEKENEVMYVQRNIESRSPNRLCHGEQKILHLLSVSVCVCVSSLSYPGSNAHVPYYIVTRDLSGSTIVVCIICTIF